MSTAVGSVPKVDRRLRFPEVPAPVVGADPRFDSTARCGLAVAVLFDERRSYEKATVYRERVGEAKLVCAECPVRASCLEFGVANQLTAVMGGQELRHGRPVADALTGGRGRGR